jgi:hypothetical protein
MIKQTFPTLHAPGTFVAPASYLRTMMKQIILSVLALPFAMMAAEAQPAYNWSVNGSGTGLCARIGVQSAAGPAMMRRDVRFQLCTPEGLPLNRQLTLELVVDPLTASFTQGIIGQSISTDSQGRVAFSYGGSTLPGQPPTQELHTFLLDGKVIASFLLQRGSEGLTFSRAPAEMARCSADGEGESRTRPCQAVSGRLRLRPAAFR